MVRDLLHVGKRRQQSSIGRNDAAVKESLLGQNECRATSQRGFDPKLLQAAGSLGEKQTSLLRHEISGTSLSWIW